MLAIPSPTVAAQLARLDALDRSALAAEWVSAFEIPAPRKASREFLLKAMAHHVQVAATRDVRPAVRRALLHIGRASRDGAAPELPPEAQTLKPGARLIRAWRGQTHEVTVAPDGRFAWQGRRYRSLSLIASEPKSDDPTMIESRPKGRLSRSAARRLRPRRCHTASVDRARSKYNQTQPCRRNRGLEQTGDPLPQTAISGL